MLLFISECITQGHKDKFGSTLCKHMLVAEHMKTLSISSETCMLAKTRGLGRRRGVNRSPGCQENCIFYYNILMTP